ncbi:MAG TPA: 5-oxoprolinase subunit PxpB [Chitinophagaceae bacterium]|nr:5-oxoprolinase subunit PxpB [Chitinophagaceae bacterium]
MKYPIIPYRIFPLGDSAVTVDFDNSIDEKLNDDILKRVRHLRLNPPEGMIEVTPAYSSFTVYYDVMALRRSDSSKTSSFELIKKQLEEFMLQSLPDDLTNNRMIEVPVCYSEEFAPDIEKLAVTKNLSVEEVIQIHLSGNYKVYMLGFLPGFAYMGKVDERISMPRKTKPENVMSGSVGIAGTQTGIYPLTSPGGWHIIGRTLLKLFDKEKEDSVLLKPGDKVRFTSISKHEFENY